MFATVFRQSNTYMAAPDQKQSWNKLDHSLYTLQKYLFCKSRVEIGHSLVLADFTDFLLIEMLHYHFLFIFYK